jgi:hydrogenase-4 component E
MSSLFEPLLVTVLLLNMFVLGASRLRAVIGASAAQGVCLGILTVTAHGELTVYVVVIALAAIAIKAIVIPRLLYKAMRDVVIVRDVEPLIGLIPSLVIGALGTVFAVVFAGTLPFAGAHEGTLVLPSSLATVLTGCIVLTTHRKAITQVVGYLILENGIFILGLSLLDAMPFLVEVGVLLDLVVGIFVMAIIINHVSREFSVSTDAAELSELKE